MARPRSSRTLVIRRFVLARVDDTDGSLTNKVVSEFKISRQAAARHLAAMTSAGLLQRFGTTRSVRYEARLLHEQRAKYRLTDSLEEHIILANEVSPIIGDLPSNVQLIASYGFTEIVNNARDHSEGDELATKVRLTTSSLHIWILDNGVGVFQKIADALSLDNFRHAVFELSKGKVTSDPERHSGEGIFFTSKVFDAFALMANGLAFMTGADGEWLLEPEVDHVGTTVYLRLSLATERNLHEVFERYSRSDVEMSFDKTVLPVKLARIGPENLVSRSQAKRLLARIDRFKEIILDFKDIQDVGQAFMDEIFRVYVKMHPEIHLVWINTSPRVEKMIRRVLSRQTEEST